ncbi:MAG: YabP/YqfC family sporulation protein [Clostridia bacterium]|nr:YabP/YqfC family sporulation protein [Clostridia bacterium]
MSQKFKFKSNHKKPKINFSLKNDAPEIGFNDPRIEMLFNKEITLEGCKGVLEYKDNYIKLKLQKGSLQLCGEDFGITHFENNTITVKGKITTLEFCI